MYILTFKEICLRWMFGRFELFIQKSLIVHFVRRRQSSGNDEHAIFFRFSWNENVACSSQSNTLSTGMALARTVLPNVVSSLVHWAGMLYSTGWWSWMQCGFWWEANEDYEDVPFLHTCTLTTKINLSILRQIVDVFDFQFHGQTLLICAITSQWQNLER